MKADQAAPLDLARFFELSMDSLCIVDRSGCFVRVNASFQRMLGYTDAELTGCGYIQFVHEEDRAATDHEAARLNAGEPLQNFVNRYRCRDGSWKRLSWSCSPPDEAGLVYAVARDVTEAWRAREERQAEQARVLRYQSTLLQLRDEEHEMLEEFLRVVTEACARTIETERVSVWFFSEHEDEITCGSLYRHETGTHEAGMILRRADAPSYFRTVTRHDALVVRDARTDAATRELSAGYLEPGGIVSMLDVPIRSGSRLAGILCFEHVGSPREWDALEEKFAASAAAYLMGAIERAERRASEAQVRELAVTLERRVIERTTELAASEKRFRSMVEGVQDYAIFALDPAGRVSTWNIGARRIKGYLPEEIIGRHFSCFYLEEDRAMRQPERLLAAAEKDGHVSDEGWRLRKDGERFWARVVISAIRDDDGKLREFAQVTHDLTELRRAESELRASEEQFRSAMENSAIGMALVAPDGRWLKANRALCEIVGYSEKELRELDFQRLTHSEDLPKDLEQVRRVLEGGAVGFQLEKRYLHKSGAVVWALLNVTLVRDAAGAPRYFISQVQDITERRKADEALRSALEHQRELTRLAQAGERAQSEFLAMMSHEVRTPMNGILGYSELLVQLPGLPEEGRTYAETILGSGTALLRILDDILDWSRLDAGALKIVPEPFSPSEMLQEICTLLLPAAARKGLALLTDVEDAAVGEFLGDAGRVRQIVLNLAGNAIKFTEHGSVTIGARICGAEIEFFVRDTGSGISPGDIDRMFDPFVQADSGHSRRHGGAGLGLAISRSLAALMKGLVTVTSEVGRGSEFLVRLPLSKISSRGAEAPAPVEAAALDGNFAARHPLSLLVVEDDTVNLRLILTMLRKLGYAPLSARDGVEALDVYCRERPQCVLMDVQMPRMDGIAAAHEIRRIEAEGGGERAFLCALTADTLVSDREHCLRAGMDDYLNKPLSRIRLTELLESISAQSRR